ncbi:hypothetical protein MAR_021460 [Mya arenaria]|uniref:G-protein coupled receptors family 1 profile domain-containing protein n=1 Tax=Mya arenaria TaxID=6604 RepID=A0ABY7EBR0_MYAAR|nr:hypothetical protein MAR_021460 [Mya arenaria]
MANAMLAQNNAIIILCLCELLGIIGNIAVFVFYRTKTKQTSTVLLIEIMSIQDTLVCLVNTHNVYEMSMKYFSFRRNANNTSAFETNLGENASTWPLPGMRTDQHTLKVRKTPNEMDPPENAHSRPVHERIVKSPPPEERKDLNETSETYSTNDDDDLSEPELSTGVGIDYNKRNHSADSSLPLRQRIRKLRRKKLKLRKKEVRITLMMFTLSMVYVLCFVPYIIVKGKDLKYKVGHELELNVYQQLALRMPYLNSVINPFVYLICNKTFRKFLSIRCCFHMF